MSKAETVRLNPKLECRREEVFNPLQNWQHSLLVALSESERDGYLVGSSLGSRLCESKILNDIAKLEVVIATTRVQQIVLTQQSSNFDKIGLIGKKKIQEFFSFFTTHLSSLASLQCCDTTGPTSTSSYPQAVAQIRKAVVFQEAP